jgi:CRP/FNR family cyclic AMP-dependent transcriptional regulator
MKSLTLIDKAFLLKRTPLFAMLDLDLLLVISDKLESLSLDDGDVVFTVSEPGTRVYFIVKGTILLEEESGKPIAELTTPDFFGDESLFSEKPRAYMAKSLGDSFLLTLSKTNLLTIISECPQVAVGLLQAYTSTNQIRLKKEPN